MLELALIGVTLVGLTVLIHALGTTFWMRRLVRRWESRGRKWNPRHLPITLISTALVLLTLHVLEVILWAVSYLLFVPGRQLESFEEAVYFSLVTFSTLGYGDITIGPGWRILSGIEALSGILLVGWTTALLFSVLQRYWKSLEQRRGSDA